MSIEISRKIAQAFGSVEKTIKNLCFTVWSSERIKKAFNNGHGTQKDFTEYKNNNINYCIFMDISESDLNALISEGLK